MVYIYEMQNLWKEYVEEQIVSVKDDLSEMVSTSPKVYSQINLRLMESIKLIP